MFNGLFGISNLVNAQTRSITMAGNTTGVVYLDNILLSCSSVDI